MKIKNALSGLLICCIFSSCATLFNKRSQLVIVHTSKPSKLIVDNDTTETKENQAPLFLLRGGKPVVIVAETDILSQIFKIKPTLSAAYWLNIFPFSPGYIVDLWSPKRFSYPSNIYLDTVDKSNKFKTYRSPQKGNIFFQFSLNPINAFKLKPEEKDWRMRVGVFGATGGLEHHYSKSRSYTVSAGFAVAGTYGIGRRGDEELPIEEMISMFLAASHNHTINRVSLSYGIAYTTYSWELQYKKTTIPKPRVGREYGAFGPVLSSYYLIGQNVNIGVLYRPTFIRFNNESKFQYEHIVSFGMMSKLRL